MKFTEKIKQYIRNKNLNPMNNRKKVGIILFGTSIGLFFLFASRLTYVVVVGKVAGESLEAKTQALYEGSRVVQAKRGSILDRFGNPIAEDATSYSVYAILDETYTGLEKKKLYLEEKNFDKVAEVFKKYLKIKESKTLEYLNNGMDRKKAGEEVFQVEFGNDGKNISLNTKNEMEADLEKAGVEGIQFSEHPARIYPNGTFASHFIGFVQPADAENESKGLTGVMGVEKSFNDILSGTNGKIYYEKDQYGNPLPGTVAEEKKAVDGQDVYTTLDARLQSYLETLMDQANKKFKPENMTAILMKADTAEILAMSQRPTFDPEKQLKNDDLWRNMLVEDAYEPGSTMKILTMAAALNEGVVDPNETFKAGTIKLYDATINDWDFGEKGYLTYRQALSWSSNVGMVHLQEKLGDKWLDYLHRFDFGQSTNSGLTPESSGSVPTNNAVDMAMSAFGQQVSVTNFQMMRAFTAIANDGTMLQPHFISKIVDTQKNKERVIGPEVLGQPVSAEAAKTVREFMIDTTEDPEYGLAYDVYKVNDEHVAAKTGTAQIYNPETGEYYLEGTNYIYSVVEMVPANQPRYILYITMQHPTQDYDKTSIATIANPLLKRAMDLEDQDAQVTEDLAEEKVEVADYRNLSGDEAASDARRNGLEPVVIGNGEKISEQSTKAGEKLLPNQRLILLTGGEHLMPDITDWSKNDITHLAKLLGITVSFEGEGYATKQSIAPGAKVTDQLTVTLSQ